MENRFSPEQEERITGFLKKVKFRKQIFGGVREADVWKKIGELNELYRQALLAERARYDALLEERGRGAAGAGASAGGGGVNDGTGAFGANASGGGGAGTAAGRDRGKAGG